MKWTELAMPSPFASVYLQEQHILPTQSHAATKQKLGLPKDVCTTFKIAESLVNLTRAHSSRYETLEGCGAVKLSNPKCNTEEVFRGP